MQRGLHIPKNPENVVEYAVYDCSLPLEERRTKKVIISSGLATANYLGVVPKTVYNNAANRWRIWSPRFQKWFAVRKNA